MGGLEPLEFAKFWRDTLSAEGEKKGLFLEALMGGGRQTKKYDSCWHA